MKSALATTAQPVTAGRREAASTRQGGGFVDLRRADRPLVFTRPSTVSFAFVRRGRTAIRRVSFSDAGGGAGDWTVSLELQARPRGVRLTAPARLAVPGTLTLRMSVARRAAQGDVRGFAVVRRAGESRRIAFWGRVTAPQLGRHRARLLRRTGTYAGNTRGRRALVSVYRYPDNPAETGIVRFLRGPEQVFRVRLRRPAANLGVAILGRGPGVRVQPRIVLGADENRQAGPTALPLNSNPYLPTFFEAHPVSGVIRPAAGTYHVVFDSPTRAGAGRFRFRFWIGDETRPRVRLLTPSVRAGGTLALAATDRGAGVDPLAIFAAVDGSSRRASYSRRRSRITIPVGRLSSGRHRLVIQVSDHQEAKNMENAFRILPNTTRLEVSFSVR